MGVTLGTFTLAKNVHSKLVLGAGYCVCTWSFDAVYTWSFDTALALGHLVQCLHLVIITWSLDASHTWLPASLLQSRAECSSHSNQCHLLPGSLADRGHTWSNKDIKALMKVWSRVTVYSCSNMLPVQSLLRQADGQPG